MNLPSLSKVAATTALCASLLACTTTTTQSFKRVEDVQVAVGEPPRARGSGCEAGAGDRDGYVLHLAIK